MRILHFINNTTLSWYTMLTDTLRAQERFGHEIYVCVPPGGENFDRLSSDGFHAIALPIHSSKFDYIAMMKLAGIIRSKKIDVMNTHLTSAALLGSAASGWAGVPCVASVLKMTKKRRYSRCEKLMPCSDAVKECLLDQGVAPTKMRRIYTGIDVDRFMEGLDCGDAREEFGFKPEHKVIGTIARLAPMKGHRVLLDAMPQVFSACPQARLLIVGDGELRRELEHQAETLHISDKTTFAGTRWDLQKMLNTIDVSVLASVEKEGLPIILVQSVLASRPVVMTDVAGIREVVKDMETGRLVAPGDAAALSAAIQSALADPAESTRMADSARTFVAREFNVNYTAGQMIEVYSEVIEKRKNR